MTPATPAEIPAESAPVNVGHQPRWTRNEWLLLGLLLLAVTAAYLPIRHAGFIWDDEHHLTENPCIIGPLGLKDIWTTAAANYFPLVLTTMWLEHAIWGLAPLPYHIVNVLLHVAAAVLLWRVLRRLRVPGAWLGAFLWALHPVQVESVAWISEMKNTQSAVFYLAAAWFFLRWLEPPNSRAAYVLALVCAVCAILSKASTVMLPVALGLGWWWQARDWRWRRMLWLIPFGAVSLIASGWTIWEQKFHSGALGAEWSQSLPERTIIAGKVVWFYLGKLLWPDPLVFVYPRWSIDARDIFQYLPFVAVVAILLGSLWLVRGIGRPAFFCFGYFVALLFPVLGFFDVYFFRYSYVGDHFQYLASMGPIALAAAAIAKLFQFSGRTPQRVRLIYYSFVAGVSLLLGTMTWAATKTYFSVETLWRTTLEKNPRCWLAAYNLGTALATTGKIDDTIALFEKAIALKPDYTDAQINLGNALMNTGRAEAAVPHFIAALEIEPHNANAHYNLALSLATLSRNDEAIRHLQDALSTQPDDADTQFHLGGLLYERGDAANALTYLQKAAKLKPNDVEAHYRCGLVLFDLRRVAGAVDEWQRALALQPNHVGAAESLAWVLATNPNAPMRNGVRALALIQNAIRISSQETALRLCTLAAAEAETGRFTEAVEAAERARRAALVEGDREMVNALEGHLANYRRHQPIRDPAQQ